jgi:hypothetical protein
LRPTLRRHKLTLGYSIAHAKIDGTGAWSEAMRFGFLVALILANAAWAQPLPRDALDFLIQDVCVDANDRAIPGDPASCPRHRDLKPLERTPFLRTDNEAGKLYQGITSHPVISPMPGARIPRIAAPKEFGGDDPTTAFRDFDLCLPGVCKPRFRDGDDIFEAEGAFAAIVGTSDPGINGQIFIREGCSGGAANPANQEDSWLVFPTNISANRSGSKVARLNIVRDDSCTWFYNSAYTEWRLLPQKVTFTTGKTLAAVMSDHFGGRSPATADHIERFYFTREYGFTRWERWSVGNVTVKAHGCNGETQIVRDGQSYRRTDCRDFSHVVPQATPFLPDVYGPSWPLNGAPNLVQNATFANGRLDGWSVQGQAVASGLAAKNMALNIVCGDDCRGRSAVQDIVIPPEMRGRKSLRFGGLFKANRDANLSIKLTLLDDTGRKLRDIVRPLTLRESFQSIDSDEAIAGERVAAVRLELAPETPDASYVIDEIYLIARPY